MSLRLLIALPYYMASSVTTAQRSACLDALTFLVHCHVAFQKARFLIEVESKMSVKIPEVTPGPADARLYHIQMFLSCNRLPSSDLERSSGEAAICFLLLHPSLFVCHSRAALKALVQSKLCGYTLLSSL